MQEKERVVWLDWARTFAISSVILVHMAEKVFRYNTKGMAGTILIKQAMLFAMFTIGRLGVPIFLMLSGYLLLKRDFDTEYTKKFWSKRWLGLLITTEIWIVLFSFFVAWLDEETWNIKLVAKQMLFMQRIGIAHMWYMPMILGIYIFIPFISSAVKKIDTKMLFFPLLIVGTVWTIIPTVTLVLNALGRDVKLKIGLDMTFSGRYYGLLLILGYLVYKGAFSKIKTSVLSVMFIANMGGTVLFLMWIYSIHYKYNLWYNFPLLVVAAVCLFELLSRVNFKHSALIEEISKCSFGIYIIHHPIGTLLVKNLKIQSNWLKLIIVYVVVFAISFGIVKIISYTKYLKKYLFAES